MTEESRVFDTLLSLCCWSLRSPAPPPRPPPCRGGVLSYNFYYYPTCFLVTNNPSKSLVSQRAGAGWLWGVVGGESSAGSRRRGVVGGESADEPAEPAGGQRGNMLKAGGETAASQSQKCNCIKAHGGGGLGDEPRLCKAAGEPCKGGGKPSRFNCWLAGWRGHPPLLASSPFCANGRGLAGLPPRGCCRSLRSLQKSPERGSPRQASLAIMGFSLVGWHPPPLQQAPATAQRLATPFALARPHCIAFRRGFHPPARPRHEPFCTVAFGCWLLHVPAPAFSLLPLTPPAGSAGSSADSPPTTPRRRLPAEDSPPTTPQSQPAPARWLPPSPPQPPHTPRAGGGKVCAHLAFARRALFNHQSSAVGPL